jgi:hypothetical protein
MFYLISGLDLKDYGIYLNLFEENFSILTRLLRKHECLLSGRILKALCLAPLQSGNYRIKHQAHAYSVTAHSAAVESVAFCAAKKSTRPRRYSSLAKN